jgi:hypothetical protein
VIFSSKKKTYVQEMAEMQSGVATGQIRLPAIGPSCCRDLRHIFTSAATNSDALGCQTSTPLTSNYISAWLGF